jgi:hypothetical protein
MFWLAGLIFHSVIRNVIISRFDNSKHCPDFFNTTERWRTVNRALLK